MTIEERAKEYASKQAIQSYSYCGYLHGATDQDPISRAEQKKIDIEKACKCIAENIDKCISTARDQTGEYGFWCDKNKIVRLLKQAMEG